MNALEKFIQSLNEEGVQWIHVDVLKDDIQPVVEEYEEAQKRIAELEEDTLLQIACIESICRMLNLNEKTASRDEIEQQLAQLQAEIKDVRDSLAHGCHFHCTCVASHEEELNKLQAELDAAKIERIDLAKIASAKQAQIEELTVVARSGVVIDNIFFRKMEDAQKYADMKNQLEPTDLQTGGGGVMYREFVCFWINRLCVKIAFKLEDFWIGCFWQRKGDVLFVYLCILPCLPIILAFFPVMDLKKEAK